LELLASQTTMVKRCLRLHSINNQYLSIEAVYEIRSLAKKLECANKYHYRPTNPYRVKDQCKEMDRPHHIRRNSTKIYSALLTRSIPINQYPLKQYQSVIWYTNLDRFCADCRIEKNSIHGHEVIVVIIKTPKHRIQPNCHNSEVASFIVRTCAGVYHQLAGALELPPESQICVND